MKFLDSIRAAIARIRKPRDTHRQAVRVSNKALRAAQARRRARQAKAEGVAL